MNVIKLHIQVGEMLVNGDTFVHKALLKHLSFRWAPAQKLWHRVVKEQDTLDYIVKVLEVNGVQYTADATVNFNVIDEERMRSIREAMLVERMKIV